MLVMVNNAELSARTFCTFPREFSSFRRQGRPWESAAHPRTRFFPSPRATARSASPGQSRPDVRGRGARWSEGGQFSGDKAAASIDALPISGLANEVGYLHDLDVPVCPKL